jgi:anaerobic C4-dicarboxylate transporter DcuA
VRPERPIAVATIASQQAITASPVSAATAAMIAVLSSKGIGLVQILMICVPSTLIGVIVAALVQNHIGVELDADPEYRRRLASGELKEDEAKPAVDDAAADAELKRKYPRAALSAGMFLAGVAVVVLCGLFPVIRTVPGEEKPVPAKTTTQTVTATAQAAAAQAGTNPTDYEANLPKPIVVSMPMTIAIVMLALAALMLIFTGAPASEILRTKTAQAGLTAVIGILGLAWLGDTFIADNKDVIIGGLSNMARQYPATFSIGLFVTSMLLFSQAATARTLMPLGLTLGIAPAALAGMFPAVNGYFFIPTYGTIIAAVNFDRSGTTRIGRYVLNHSFMLPGLISTIVAVVVGLGIGKLFF